MSNAELQETSAWAHKPDPDYINYSAESCLKNKLLADYLGQTDQVNWDACQYTEL